MMDTVHNGSARATVIMVLVLGLLLAAALAGAGDHKSSVTISTDDDGEELVVVVSELLARSVVERLIGSELSCDGAVDGEFGELLRTLDRRGRGARASLTTDDSVIRARRRSSTLKLKIRDLDDDGTVEVVMPWAVAECLLGRSVTIDRSIGTIKVEIKGADGGRFAFKVD